MLMKTILWFFSTISGIKFKLGRYPNVICAILLKSLDRYSASTASLYSKPKTETTGNDMVALTNWYSGNSDINKDATFFILLLNYKRWVVISLFSQSPKQASVFIWKHCSAKYGEMSPRQFLGSSNSHRYHWTLKFLTAT